MCSEPKPKQPERCVEVGSKKWSDSNKNWKKASSLGNKKTTREQLVNFDDFHDFGGFSVIR